MTTSPNPQKEGPRFGGLPLKTRVFNLTALAVLFVMLFMLLKENEGRVAAEEKLKDMRFKVDAYASENENTILSLEGRVSELENKLQEAQTANAQLTAESQKQIADLKAQLEESGLTYDQMRKQKTDEISDLEKKSLDDTAKLNAFVKDKNQEIAELSARLKDSSAQMDALIRKKQALETKNLAMADELTQTKGRLKVLERQHAELAGQIKDAQDQKQIKD